MFFTQVACSSGEYIALELSVASRILYEKPSIKLGRYVTTKHKPIIYIATLIKSRYDVFIVRALLSISLTNLFAIQSVFHQTKNNIAAITTIVKMVIYKSLIHFEYTPGEVSKAI